MDPSSALPRILAATQEIVDKATRQVQASNDKIKAIESNINKQKNQINGLKEQNISLLKNMIILPSSMGQITQLTQSGPQAQAFPHNAEWPQLSAKHVPSDAPMAPLIFRLPSEHQVPAPHNTTSKLGKTTQQNTPSTIDHRAYQFMFHEPAPAYASQYRHFAGSLHGGNQFTSEQMNTQIHPDRLNHLLSASSSSFNYAAASLR